MTEAPCETAGVHRPVVAVDVDGVVNVFADRPDLQTHTVTLRPEDVDPHPFAHPVPDEGITLTVHVDVTLGPWLTALAAAGADVRWCSTWGRAANLHIAPLLGIAPLPWIDLAAFPPRFGELRNGDVGRGRHVRSATPFPAGRSSGSTTTSRTTSMFRSRKTPTSTSTKTTIRWLDRRHGQRGPTMNLVRSLPRCSRSAATLRSV